MSREKPETGLQGAIIDALRSDGVWVERIFTGVARVRRGFIHGARKGFPDLLCIGRGYCGLIEVKRAGKDGRVSPEQLECIARLETLGHNVAVVTSPAEALQAVRSWRLRAEREGRAA